MLRDGEARCDLVSRHQRLSVAGTVKQIITELENCGLIRVNGDVVVLHD